jgi:hypothetical protein
MIIVLIAFLIYVTIHLIRISIEGATRREMVQVGGVALLLSAAMYLAGGCVAEPAPGDRTAPELHSYVGRVAGSWTLDVDLGRCGMVQQHDEVVVGWFGNVLSGDVRDLHGELAGATVEQATDISPTAVRAVVAVEYDGGYFEAELIDDRPANGPRLWWARVHQELGDCVVDEPAPVMDRTGFFQRAGEP